MESDRIYEESLEEINSIKKSLAFDSIVIHMNKLDGESKRVITEALAGALEKRKTAITSTLTGVRA